MGIRLILLAVALVDEVAATEVPWAWAGYLWYEHGQAAVLPCVSLMVFGAGLSGQICIRVSCR